MDKTKQINEIFDAYEKDLDNFGTCELGSCQYQTANATYSWALDLLNLIGYSEFNNLLKTDYEHVMTEEDFEEHLYQVLSNTIDASDPEDDALAKDIIKYDGRIPIEDYYAICGDHAWDLWSAYEYPFEGFTMGKTIGLPTIGPILNQEVQGENFKMGVALAFTTFLFNTDISVFADFDT